MAGKAVPNIVGCLSHILFVANLVMEDINCIRHCAREKCVHSVQNVVIGVTDAAGPGELQAHTSSKIITRPMLCGGGCE